MDHMLKDLTNKMEGQPLTIYEQHLFTSLPKNHTLRAMFLWYNIFFARSFTTTPCDTGIGWSAMSHPSTRVTGCKTQTAGCCSRQGDGANRCKEWKSLVFSHGIPGFHTSRPYKYIHIRLYTYIYIYTVTPVGYVGVTRDKYMYPTWRSFHYPLEGEDQTMQIYGGCWGISDFIVHMFGLVT